MHMTDALLSPIVGLTMYAVSGSATAYAAIKLKPDSSKLPLMAVSGAFVFAAQMINITIPGTGSSGHLGGGLLLAALLGGFPALLVMTAILTIQSLFFADGGLLALGCNLFNLGVIPCLILYPLIFKPFVHKKLTTRRLTIASMLTAIVALTLGALAVVLETTASGVAELPFIGFAAVMLPIHLVIGIGEGIVTAAILCFIHKTRPDLLKPSGTVKRSMKLPLMVTALVSLLLAGGLSIFASVNPDGLEWSIERLTGASKLPSAGMTTELQEERAPMPDYAFRDGEGAPIAAMIGCGLTFVAAGAVGVIVTRVKKKDKGKVKA